jgi:hypothetical protein
MTVSLTPRRFKLAINALTVSPSNRSKSVLNPWPNERAELQEYGYKFLCFLPELDVDRTVSVSSARTEHYYQNI